MQISLRSQMIAGVAAVGAVAIAVNPTIQPDVIPSMQRVAAAVQLSAVANPISAVGTVLQYLNSDIFSSIYADDYYGGYLNWPSPVPLGGNGYNFYSWYETCANQANCDANPQVIDTFYGLQYSPGYLGLIPDFVNQFSLGGLAALATNFSEYGQAALAIPLALVTDGSQALFNAPGALVAAIKQLAAGDSAGAITTLKDEILAPLTAGFEQSFNALSYIVNNAIANLQSVINIGLPGLLGDVSKQIAAGATYMVQSAVYTVQAVFQDITKLDFKQAWNDSIYGFLGPNGTLGQFESLTAGLGVIQYDDVNQSWGVTIPSIRSVLTSWGQHFGDYRLQYVNIDQTDGYPKIVEGGGCSADDASGASGTCRWGGIQNDPFYTPPVSSASSVAPSAAATRGARAAAAVAAASETAASETAAPQTGTTPESASDGSVSVPDESVSVRDESADEAKTDSQSTAGSTRRSHPRAGGSTRAAAGKGTAAHQKSRHGASRKAAKAGAGD